MWSDEDLPSSSILRHCSLYWFTDTISSSFWSYRGHHFSPETSGIHSHPKWYLDVPLGFSSFPKDIYPIPQSWAATTGNLVFYRSHSDVRVPCFCHRGAR